MLVSRRRFYYPADPDPDLDPGADIVPIPRSLLRILASCAS